MGQEFQNLSCFTKYSRLVVTVVFLMWLIMHSSQVQHLALVEQPVPTLDCFATQD